MRNTLQIDLEKIELERLKELFQILDEASAECGTNYYIIGALAKLAWYSTTNIGAGMTRDVDIAVNVMLDDQYEKLVHTLVNKHKFRKIKHDPLRLQSPFGYTMDMIPFGIKSIDEKVDSEDNVTLFVNGFQEVANKGTVKAIDREREVEFEVATLPAILLLKLIAYGDRPEHRTQDPSDIRDIITHYFDIEDRLIYDRHNDLFDKYDELDEIAAVVIGRQIRDIIEDNPKLSDRVLGILSSGKLVMEMTNEQITVNQAKRWFGLIAEGIKK
ncbi:MAG: hypothetical protein WD098_00075 [Balneolales bacterium]